MGFFSAVKRFFGSKEPEQAQNEVRPETTQEDAIFSGKVNPYPENAQIKTDTQQREAQDLQTPESSTPEQVETADPGENGTVGNENIAYESENKIENSVASSSTPPIQISKQPSIPETTPPEIAEDTRAGEEALLLRLRQAEPKLSSWLDIILEGQDETNAELWQRLRFFLRSLEAPEQEIDSFVNEFAVWLQRMEYSHVDEFRSELQYRLALALDMEDEEDERNRLMLKLSQSLAATREQLGRQLDSLFSSHGELTDAFWEEMEEMFIMADIGYEASLKIVESLKRRAAQQKLSAAADARQLLQDELEEIFRQRTRIRAANKPEVILMMGVNGAGKTTTIAKLAHRARMEGKKPLVVAADTFRAAAIEQLEVWAQRAGAEFYAKPAGSDPASVAWEAMDYARQNDIDVVFVDTAGRLQTKVNLMEELGKIRQVLAKKQPGAPHRSLLVLDATTGQNALSQAKLFRDAAGADEIILTKLDGTAKGGVAIAVAMQEGLPITFVGLGEKMEDLRPFNGRDFAKALLVDAA